MRTPGQPCWVGQVVRVHTSTELSGRGCAAPAAGANPLPPFPVRLQPPPDRDGIRAGLFRPPGRLRWSTFPKCPPRPNPLSGGCCPGGSPRQPEGWSRWFPRSARRVRTAPRQSRFDSCLFWQCRPPEGGSVRSALPASGIVKTIEGFVHRTLPARRRYRPWSPPGPAVASRPGVGRALRHSRPRRRLAGSTFCRRFRTTD